MADASERHDDASDDEAEEWPEGQCGLCEQSFEQQDEDCLNLPNPSLSI